MTVFEPEIWSGARVERFYAETLMALLNPHECHWTRWVYENMAPIRWRCCRCGEQELEVL